MEIRPNYVRIIKAVAFVPIFIAAIIIIKDEVFYQSGYYDDTSASPSCNVTHIPLYGELLSYPTDAEDHVTTLSLDVVRSIEDADTNPDIEAIVLKIDSYGGDLLAGQEIADALKRASKPTVALIRSQGLSAAYLAATGADTIFSSPLSDVGSIGVTMSYLDHSESNTREGYNFNILSSGPFKDLTNPDKTLTQAEKELLLRDINKSHELFVAEVASNRNLPPEQVIALADGSSMLGNDAKENGLIDQLGDLADVRDYISSKIDGEIVICG